MPRKKLKKMSNLPPGAEFDPNAPWNNEYEDECAFCGEPCNGTYCSDDCERADNDDRKYY